jgi:NlpC/P60 family putative phage cell wall peptidase
MTRSDIVAMARGWIGTPYRHQHSVRGAGTDCLGLVRGIWREAFGHEPEPIPPYTPDWGEPEGHEILMEAADRWLLRRSAVRPEPGDVLLFRIRPGAIAKHLGVLSEAGEAPRFVHAYSGHAVLESHLTAPWQRKIAAIYTFPIGDN